MTAKKVAPTALKAHKVTENRAVFTIEEAVNFAIDAAIDAYAATARDSDGGDHNAFMAAKEAYRNCMPLLETRASVKCFIACVAQGVHLEFISMGEAKLLLYGAQVWIQVEDGKVAA